MVAVDHKDALDHCRYHSTLLCELLGLDRGQKPREFACVAYEYGGPHYWRIFQQPWYRGNLAADFNPVSTANMIERVVPKLQATPFLRFLLKTYADATAEEDPDFALLRFWSVLELLADKYVLPGACIRNPDGSLILNAKGNPETTDPKHCRVYQYVLSAGSYAQSGIYEHGGVQKKYMVGADPTHPGYSQGAELISLWDLVRSVYDVRNAVAHEGQFDLHKARTGDQYCKLAARLILEAFATPHVFIKSQAHISVMRELNSPRHL